MVRLFAALLLAACIPGRHPVEGRACDGEHPCPDELLCYNLACRDVSGAAGGSSGGGAGGGAGGGTAAACTNNLLTGGGFEDGMLASIYWNGMFTNQGATVRTGAYAARLDSAGTLRTQLTAIAAVAGSDHCAEAWVRSSGGTVGLQLGRWLASTDLSAETTVTADGSWQRLTNRFAYPTGLVGLTVHVNAPAGTFVDDVCVQVCP